MSKGVTLQRSLEVPSRDELLRSYAILEKQAILVLCIEAIAIIALGAWIFLRPPTLPAGVAWFCALAGGLGIFRGFIELIFLKRKRLRELRKGVTLGIHSRESLERLADRVFARLGLPKDAVPVFIIRSKDVNASAVRRELLPGVHFMNGVYLNRSILHLLDEPELESVVGHELGHVFPYAPLLSRCYLVHALFGAVGALWLAGILASTGFVLLAPFLMIGLVEWIVVRPWVKLGRGIEFLCDDFGARAAGLLPALSSEMKLAAENETRCALLGKVLEMKLNGTSTSLGRLIEIYDEAVPFGNSDPEAVRKELQRLLTTQATRDTGLSLRGFYDYVNGGNSTDQRNALKEELERLQLSAALPVALPDRRPWLMGSATWPPEHASDLVTKIEATPTHVLFRDFSELAMGKQPIQEFRGAFSSYGKIAARIRCDIPIPSRFRRLARCDLSRLSTGAANIGLQPKGKKQG